MTTPPAPKGRLWMPDHPSQEVLANGAACGNYLRELTKIWYGSAIDPRDDPARLSYPLDYFDEDADPVFTPITAVLIEARAEELPILAWAVAPDGGSAGVVVDMRERPHAPGMETEYGDPVEYTNCKVVTGRPSELFSPEMLEVLGLYI